jgi:hypothetical protein
MLCQNAFRLLPKRVMQWSLRTLRVKLIKIGAKVIRHSRYAVEISVPSGDQDYEKYCNDRSMSTGTGGNFNIGQLGCSGPSISSLPSLGAPRPSVPLSVPQS